MAHYFGAAGYMTALIGKMHFVDAQTHGFDYRLAPGLAANRINETTPLRRTRMPFITVDRADQTRTVNADNVRESLHEMFIAALLLTGSAERAECSVLKGITAMGRGQGISRHSLPSNNQSRDHARNDDRPRKL